MEIEEIRKIKVWEIDDQLAVADTVVDVVGIWKTYAEDERYILFKS